MNATELLKQQHEEVESRFSNFEASEDSAEKREIFLQLADALSAHSSIEERIFYPSVKVKDTEEMLRESVEEHLSVKRLIADILDLDAQDSNFDAKVKVLKEQVEHHVEEEEGELFPKVKKLFTRAELDTMGTEMEALYAELIQNEPRSQVPAETGEAAPLT